MTKAISGRAGDDASGVKSFLGSVGTKNGAKILEHAAGTSSSSGGSGSLLSALLGGVNSSGASSAAGSLIGSIFGDDSMKQYKCKRAAFLI